jgi:hypothetical protein
MSSSTTAAPIRLRSGATATAVAVLLGCAACSLLLDASTTQCRVDADCAQYGIHPYCRNGACVDSHLGPPGCYDGTPTTPPQFLNQCSTAACLPFDDCKRIMFCGGGDLPLVAPASPADAGPSSPATNRAADAGAPVVPNCADLDMGNVVYITGSSNFPTVLKKMAPIILKGAPPLAPGPTPVFLTTNSCTGAKTVFSSLDPDHVIHDPPPGSPLSRYAQYFLADGSSAACSLGPVGQTIDIGESDVYAATCNYTSNSVTDSAGPIQAMAFVVSVASSETAISHQAAREVFGMGGNGGAAAPWTNPDRYYVRNQNTGTQQMIGLEIGVYPGGRFWGVDQGSAQNVHDALQAYVHSSADEANSAIGIISVDVYDSDRNNLRVLAYKESDQTCAYLPDSDSNSYDKKNVRDGHYPIWGPLHFFTSFTNNSSVARGAFLNYWVDAGLNQPVIDAFIAASLVPECAMSVQRQSEGGTVQPLTPAKSCACYFEAAAIARQGGGMLRQECGTCVADDDCTSARPKCRLGYCEIK